jgi:hypothetical protein
MSQECNELDHPLAVRPAAKSAAWEPTPGRVGALMVQAALVLTLALASPAQAWATTADLPACEATAPGMSQGLSLGIVQPHASSHVVDYAARLTLADPALSICSETWSSVVPRAVPWASELERGQGWALFVLAFVLVVVGLWATTPRHWWRRTTLLGLLAVGGMTWVLGVALLAGFHGLGGQRLLYGTVVSLRTPQQARPVWLSVAGARELEAVLAQAGVLTSASAPTAGGGAAVPPPPTLPPDPPAAAASAPAGSYRVAHRLNVREGPGVQHAHIMTLPRGEEVQFDGAVQADWWRIRSKAGTVGWASSLWLRRHRGEALPALQTPGLPDAAPRS